MLQRGRKSRLQRQTLALASNAPAPSYDPPAPFYRLDEPEREIWDEIHLEYSFTYAGDLLLCMGFQSLGRARHCSEVIEKQGTSYGIWKPHLISKRRPTRRYGKHTGTGFPKHLLHKIACIGALIASRQPEDWRIDALGTYWRALRSQIDQ